MDSLRVEIERYRSSSTYTYANMLGDLRTVVRSKWQPTDEPQDYRDKEKQERRAPSRKRLDKFEMNMTDNRCVCLQCLHSSCPLPHAEAPYDEVSHEIDNNFISVRVPKNKGKFEPESIHCQEDRLSFDFNCADSQGEKCKVGCTKVHVIPHQYPPAKRPDEEMLSLKTRRHVMPDNLQNTLEIEFKAARNYIPLPEPGPAPPIIVPRQRIKKKRKGKGKGKRKRKKE